MATRSFFPKDENILARLVKKHTEQNNLCTLMTTDHPELLKTLKAVWVDEKGKVQGFGMKPPQPGLIPVHYTGYKVFSNSIFNWLPEGESNIFYEVLMEAIKKGEPVGTLHSRNEFWYETGNFQSYMHATNLVVSEKWDEVQKRRAFFDLSSLHKFNSNNSLLVCEEEADLKWHSQCFQTVVIGKNCQFSKNTKLTNCIVGDNQNLSSVSNTMLI